MFISIISMIHIDIKFKRVDSYKDNENPMLVVKIKEKKGKSLAIAALYRHWKAPGEQKANNANGISR